MTAPMATKQNAWREKEKWHWEDIYFYQHLFFFYLQIVVAMSISAISSEGGWNSSELFLFLVLKNCRFFLNNRRKYSKIGRKMENDVDKRLFLNGLWWCFEQVIYNVYCSQSGMEGRVENFLTINLDISEKGLFWNDKALIFKQLFIHTCKKHTA